MNQNFLVRFINLLLQISISRTFLFLICIFYILYFIFDIFSGVSAQKNNCPDFETFYSEKRYTYNNTNFK